VRTVVFNSKRAISAPVVASVSYGAELGVKRTKPHRRPGFEKKSDANPAVSVCQWAGGLP
jgi:hypothetical protein